MFNSNVRPYESDCSVRPDSSALRDAMMHVNQPDRNRRKEVHVRLQPFEASVELILVSGVGAGVGVLPEGSEAAGSNTQDSQEPCKESR